MNLLINFIQPHEIRSASVVSVKSLLQIGAVIIPLALVVFFGLTYIRYAEHRSTLNLLEGTWEMKETQLKRAQLLNKNLADRNRAHQEIEGWRLSRVAWSDVLDLLRSEVPPTMQLKVLQVRQTLEVAASGEARRALRLTLSGRCTGPGAEERVELLRSRLLPGSVLGDYVRAARVAGFREDEEPGAGPDDRAFQIEVNFKPRSLHAASSK